MTMPDGRGLEIKYSFGDEQVRTVVYSEKRIGAFICCIALGALGLLSHHFHQTPSDPGPTAQTEPNVKLQAASIQSSVTTDETTTNSMPVTKASTEDAAPLAAQPTDASAAKVTQIEQARPSSEDRGPESPAVEAVDISLLKITKSTSPIPGQEQWTLKVGLSNRTDKPVAGNVTANYRDLRSSPVSYRMSRYVEKTLTLSIPKDAKSPQSLATVEVRDERDHIVGRLQYDISSKQPHKTRHSAHAGGINR